MFFSLSSAMVIVTCEEIRNREGISGRFEYRKAGRLGCYLGSPPLCLNKMFRLRQYGLALGACNPIQHFIHCFLDSGIRLVKLTRSLGGKLTEHIPVP